MTKDRRTINLITMMHGDVQHIRDQLIKLERKVAVNHWIATAAWGIVMLIIGSIKIGGGLI